jgi:hypothetical protein
MTPPAWVILRITQIPPCLTPPHPPLCYGFQVLGRRFFLLAFVMPLLLGCQKPEQREATAVSDALEVEDVAPAVDSGLSTDADIKGPPIIQGVSGVLPSDYPRLLPTHEPSSVSAFGTGDDGRSFAEFDSPTPAPTVAGSLKDRLRRSGWHLEEVGDGRFRASKDGIDATFEISDLYSGSRIRVDY